MLGRITVATAFLLAAASSQAATLTAFSNSEHGLVSIDTETGAVSVIGGTYNNPSSVTGLAYDPSGVLWGIGGWNGNIYTGTINPLTGEYTVKGDSYIGGLSGASFTPDGVLYTRVGRSGQIDVAGKILNHETNSTPTQLGNLANRATGFALSTDGFFGYSFDYDNNTLLRYDLLLNTVTAVTTSANISALAFLGSTLYATTDDSADALITINPLTGAELSRIALSYGTDGAFANITALAAAPSAVPLPAGGLLLLSGLGGLLLMRRKVRRA